MLSARQWMRRAHRAAVLALALACCVGSGMAGENPPPRRPDAREDQGQVARGNSALQTGRWAIDLTLKEVPGGPLAPFQRYFSKYVNVFGVHVFATARTPDAKVLHAAHVLAQYLDNDEDGEPDNPRVAEALASRDAYLVMTANEQESERIDPEVWHREGFEAGQDLRGDETNPGEGRFDASLEEVLHLITDKGYGNVYPRVFGCRAGTDLCRCLDRARGGHFVRVPRRYPEGAWFTYDDRTCEYGSQASEYIYWALTSILGAQESPRRRREIADEWRLYSRELVRTRDPNIYRLLTDLRYRFPSVLPDGTYRDGRKGD